MASFQLILYCYLVFSIPKYTLVKIEGRPDPTLDVVETIEFDERNEHIKIQNRCKMYYIPLMHKEVYFAHCRNRIIREAIV